MNKNLQITSARIEVSANEHIEGGYYFDIRLRGILPKCRKESTLHFSVMSGYVWVTPLFGHSGMAYIGPEAWRTLMNSMPVVAQRFDKNVTITPELEAKAKAYACMFADMAAKSTVPNMPEFNEIVIVKQGVAA